MLLDGRNQKIKPLGFDTAATVLMVGFSTEAASNLTSLVREVAAKQGGHDDGKALRQLRSRLQRAAKARKSQGWATEVLTHLADARSRGVFA